MKRYWGLFLLVLAAIAILWAVWPWTPAADVGPFVMYLILGLSLLGVLQVVWQLAGLTGRLSRWWKDHVDFNFDDVAF